MRADDNVVEPYSFQNIYVITTYRCNYSCDFCLFRHNKEVEASIDEVAHKLHYAIRHSTGRVYIKITGGEPFLRPDLLKALFEVAEQHRDKVYKIGIGSNGSIVLPGWFAGIDLQTNICLSRHNVQEDLTPIQLLGGILNNSIAFRINCNLIRGAIDSLPKIEHFAETMFGLAGVAHICFRELSKVDADANSIYPPEVSSYIQYYNQHVVPLAEVENAARASGRFTFLRAVGNYYDTNRLYSYRSGGRIVNIKFRAIDETRLIEYNRAHPKMIDEYVIHPDGTLSGCWDRSLKLIMQGGSTMPSRPYITKPVQKIGWLTKLLRWFARARSGT